MWYKLYFYFFFYLFFVCFNMSSTLRLRWKFDSKWRNKKNIINKSAGKKKKWWVSFFLFLLFDQNARDKGCCFCIERSESCDGNGLDAETVTTSFTTITKDWTEKLNCLSNSVQFHGIRVPRMQAEHFIISSLLLFVSNLTFLFFSLI